MSANVRGFGIATWAADRRAFRTGRGFITAVGVVAPRISYYSFGIPPSTLAAWGLTERTHGFFETAFTRPARPNQLRAALDASNDWPARRGLSLLAGEFPLYGRGGPPRNRY
jgi:hypothetical protein